MTTLDLAIWIVTLLVVALVVVPVAVSYLRRALAAARAIERYLADMLEAGVKLAGGLVKVRDDTRELNAKVGTINQGLSGLLAPLLSANKNLGGIVTLATS